MTSYTARNYPYPDPADPADVPADTQALAAAIDSDIAACLPAMTVSTFGDHPILGLVGAGTSTVGAVNRCLSVAFKPREELTPAVVRWWCTTQNGFYDLAVINAATRVRVWSLGSTPCPAPGQIDDAVLVPFTLTAGTVYELAFSADNNTLALRAATLAASGMGTLYDGSVGVGYVAGSHPIPTPLGALTAGTVLPAIMLLA